MSIFCSHILKKKIYSENACFVKSQNISKSIFINKKTKTIKWTQHLFFIKQLKIAFQQVNQQHLKKMNWLQVSCIKGYE